MATKTQKTAKKEKAADDDAAAFVEKFIAAWADPTVEKLQELTHPDVVLEQPMMPRMVGKEGAREGFGRLLALFPGLRGEVLRWSAEGNLLMIEMRLTVPAGSRPLAWDLVDRIELDGGLVRERITYMDSLPIVLGVLRRPALWAAMARFYLPRG
ncbi:MAG TPA: nuclear transport factor 2 family protein [Solirubrobacterales bacterium]|jgi:ketosteroid isomerase-like protein